MSTSEMLSKLSTCTSTPTGMAGPAEEQRSLVKAHFSPPRAWEFDWKKGEAGSGLNSVGFSCYFLKCWVPEGRDYISFCAVPGPQWIFNRCLLHESKS